MARVTTQRCTVASRINTLRPSAVISTPVNCSSVVQYHRRRLFIVAEVATPGESCSEGSLANLSIPNTTMAKFGSSGGGAATLQRSKLNLKKEVQKVDPKTDDTGGGGNIGKIIHNGGGGGGDDDDDDDYFFEEGDDGEEGDNSFFTKVLPQLYDKISVGAVLSEWYRTVADMPVILRRAVDMGLFSSAQLVRFLSMDVRPNATRAVQRSLPTSLSRAFVGRLMADPAFCHKLLIENLLTFGFGLAYELKMRGENIKREWDLAAIHIMTMMAATTSSVWIIAPSRSYGEVNATPWYAELRTTTRLLDKCANRRQESLANLPNNVFDASGPLRQYTLVSRTVSIAVKAAELAIMGAVAGATYSAVSHLAIAGHRYIDPNFKPSYNPPSVARATTGFSLLYGLHAHLRYQLLGGVDRYFFEHSKYLWSYLTTTGVCRLGGVMLSETHRPMITGVPSKPRRSVTKKLAPTMRQPVSSNIVPAPPVQPKIKKSKGFELTMSSS